MKNKYYTPEISEFHVGFEYEILKDGEWVKTFVPEHSIGLNAVFEIKDIAHHSAKNKPRVKYLDREDIESLGWGLKVYCQKSHAGFWGKGDYTICYNEKNSNVLKNNATITCLHKEQNYVVFNGTVKNKSELKKIMSMCGI